MIGAQCYVFINFEVKNKLFRIENWKIIEKMLRRLNSKNSII
jgi:hypothetical protein